MKKRILSLLLSMLMILQLLPIEALAEGWNMTVSNAVAGTEYVNVTFQYPIYEETDDGEEISKYETIVTQMVEKGTAAVVPNIPNVSGHEFSGWVDAETNEPLDVTAALQEDTVFTAAYSKLGIYTVTINYVYDVDGSMAQESYVAEFKAGDPVDLAIASPKMNGFEVKDKEKDEVVKIHFDAINEDYTYEVRYQGQATSYTVKYWFQNVDNNDYTEGKFYRAAIHDHMVAGESGWITVGPYKIEKYPEGTTQAGKDVIAGGMTEVRDFEIEGFVQRDIEQRRVMPGGTTVVNVYYDRAVNMYTIKNDGGTAVDPQALRYGASLALPDASTMERPGYTFDGFYSKEYVEENGTWVQTGNEVKHDSSCTMPPYDFEIEVRWKPLESADYKVVYWVQSLNDAYNTSDDQKTYDFLEAVTYENGAVGTAPTITNLRPSTHGLSNTFYFLNANNSEVTGITSGTDARQATATKTIASDGSTVINVYFDRQTVTYNFYNAGNTNNSNLWRTLRGLYGQSFSEASKATGETIAWPAYPGSGYMWYNTSTRQNITYLNGFYYSGINETTIDFRRADGGTRVRRQYTENLDGTWKLEDDFAAGSSQTLNILDKFAPGFSVTGVDTNRNNELGPTRTVSVDDSVTNDYIEVYNTRNSFELSYQNCAEGSMAGAKTSYKYEEVLQEPTQTPERPSHVEADWEFAGWYLDSACQVPVNWGTYTMPAANLVVYAKWAPPTYTVTYHDKRTNTANDTVTETTEAFEVEKFASLADRTDVNAFYSEYVVGETSYYDEDDLLTYTFMGWYLDEEYTVAWDYGISVTSDREIYAKWEPKGTVYYRYVFLGMNADGTSVELGKWPEEAFDATVWPKQPYGTFAYASADFAKMGDFPQYEGWRAASTLSTTREQLTEQYQEIPVYYAPTSTWPLTIDYVDADGKEIFPSEEHDLSEAIKVYSYKQKDGYKVRNYQLTASKDMAPEADGRVHITFVYDEIQPLSYTIEYWKEQLDGSYTRAETVVYEAAEGQELGTMAYVTAIDHKSYTGYTETTHTDTKTQIILQADATRNVLSLYYDLNDYTVTYQYVGEVPDGAPALPETQTYQYGATVPVEAKPSLAGYQFLGWSSQGGSVSADMESFTMPAANVVLLGEWTADTNTLYKVEFYYQDDDGTYPNTADATWRGGGETGTEARVPDVYKDDVVENGRLWRYDADYPDNVESGIIAGDGSLVLKLYFEQVKEIYTVHHYLKGTETKVADDVTGEAQVGSTVTATAADADARLEGFAGARYVEANPQNATITITEDGVNEIILYYDMPLTLQAKSASKTYDGKRLTEGGFTVVNPENLVGIRAEDITLRMTANSGITNPGSRENTIDESSILFNGEAVPEYYTLTLRTGTLQVLSRLSVTKTVTQPETVFEGEDGPALDVPAFEFSLQNDAGPVAGAAYSVNGTEGTTGEDGHFWLNAGETAVFSGLDAGTYTVQEVFNGDWTPDGTYTQQAVIAADGAGDVSVSFNNNRRVNASTTLQKQWVDGEGEDRPDTLQFTLTGTAGGETVYTAPVTLTAAENWTKTVAGLPLTFTANGVTEYIEYRLTENDVPDGYTATVSRDGLTVTNTVTQRQLTIQGTKTWVDGARTHNNAQDVTLTLQRSTNGTSWTNYNPGSGNFAWNGNTYSFTNLPAYDTSGYAYQYRVLETCNVTNINYTTVYTDGSGAENGGLAAFDANDTATIDIRNTIVDDNTRYIYGIKTWVDGGQEHNNAEELTITLERKSEKAGSVWETVTEEIDENGYEFGWDPSNPNQYGFNGLERYDDEGYRYIYRVTESMNDSEKAALYATTYSPENGETALGESWQVNITNTLKDPEDVTVTGTKTWVDGGQDHDNESEITLTLYRTSAQPGAQAEEVDAEVSWTGNTYTYSELEKYDEAGYAYTYTVEEGDVDGYASAQAGNNFTNTIEQENLTITGTKTWSDGNAGHDTDQVSLTLQRMANEGEWEPVAAQPVWTGWTYTYENLPKYDAQGYTYTYRVQEDAITGYTTSYDTANGTADFDGDNTAEVNITNTAQTTEITVQKLWTDMFEDVQNYWNLRPEDVTVTLTGMVDGEPADGIAYTVNGQAWTTKGDDSWSATVAVRTHDAKGKALTYEVSENTVDRYQLVTDVSTEAITPADGETAVSLTNSLKLWGGDGTLTVKKTWDDMGGDESERPEVSFKLLYANGTPVTVGEAEVTAALGEDDTATFTNIPADEAGYIVEEVMTGANTGKYVCEQADNQVTLAADEAEAEFANTRTMAVVTITKQIVDETIDSENGLAQKFTFSVDDGATKSEAIGDDESVEIEVEIGKAYNLSEYTEDGSELSEKVWSTEGLGSFTADASAETITVTNTRVKQGEDGEGTIAVHKTWKDGDGEILADDLTPASVDVQLYANTADSEELITMGERLTLNAAGEWQATYEDLPAATVEGKELLYSVKELVGETGYGDGGEPVIGELKFIAEITESADGFEIVNTLEDGDPEKPIKEADEESQKDVQVGDEVTYTINRTSHLSTDATAIVTDELPDELAYASTVSVKVNGEDVSYDVQQNGNTIVWTIADVPPMGEVECVFIAKVTEKALGQIENDASVDFGDDSDLEMMSDESVIDVARFTLTKEAQLPEGKTKAGAGDVIHYTITVVGTGAAMLPGLTVEDPMFARANEGSIIRNGRVVPANQVVNNVITLDMPLRWGLPQTIEYDVTVTEADILNGSVANVATGRAPDPAGEDQPELVVTDDTDTDTEDKNGHLTVTKTTTNTPANGEGYALGEKITYTIKVENDGNLTITNIDVTDSLSKAEGQVIGTIASLAPGESKDFSFEYEVTEADILNGTVKNVATATGDSPDPEKPDPDVDPGDTEDDTDDKNGHLTVTKTTTSTPANEKGYALGEKITYTIKVENDGNLTITNIDVTDSLSKAEGQVIGTIASLAPGESKDFSFEYEVTEADILNGTVKNVATATGDSPDPEKPDPDVDPGDTEDDTDDKNGHLTVTKTTTSTPANEKGYVLGEKITYTIKVENDGNLTITNIDVTDSLSKAEGQVIGTIASLAPGESKDFSFEYEVTEADILNGTVKNVATATGDSPDPEKPDPDVDPGETEDDTDDKNGHLTVTKTTTSTPANEKGYALGEKITYTIKVENDGNLTITNIDVTDSLSKAEGQVIGTIASLAPGESKDFSFEYEVTEADILNGTVKNVATATGDSPDPEKPDPDVDPGETEDDTDDKNGHLTVTKTTTSTPANEKGYALGEKITYTIKVENDGNLTITNIDVTDSLSTAEGQVIGTIASLAPGESKDFSFEYEVTEADILNGTVKNVATATGDSPDPEKPDPDVDPGDTEDDTDDKNGHLTLKKTTTSKPANGTAYEPGEKITYSIVATNDGNLTLTDVVVTDELTGDEWKVDSLAPNALKTFTAEYVVTEADTLKGRVRNAVVATGKSPDEEKPDPDVVPDETEDPVVTDDPSLFLDKEAEQKDGGYEVGDTIPYTIRVVNNGNVTIRDVEVKDTLTGDVWTIASIAPGEEKLFTAEYVVTKKDQAEGSVINEATIKGTDPEGQNVDGNDVVEVPVNQDKPAGPKKPDKETEKETEVKTTAPGTGDTTNWLGWLLVLAASGGVLTVGTVRRRRKNGTK